MLHINESEAMNMQHENSSPVSAKLNAKCSLLLMNIMQINAYPVPEHMADTAECIFLTIHILMPCQ